MTKSIIRSKPEWFQKNGIRKQMFGNSFKKHLLAKPKF
jgi:hypothetical protein